MTLERLLILSAILFSIGLYGALAKRNVITILMAIELMFNAVNVALVAVSRYIAPYGLRTNPVLPTEEVLQTLLTGQVFAIFIIAVSAAEIALGLAIVIVIYRSRETIDVSEMNLLSR